MPKDGPLSHLVVVGSSAGGVQALSDLVSTLPADLPVPIVIAQHLDPAGERATCRRSSPGAACCPWQPSPTKSPKVEVYVPLREEDA